MKSSKSKKLNRAWLADHLNDPYVKQAQKDGYRSRAAYKLQELDQVFRLFKPGQKVVDLGAAPGAWSQYLGRKILAVAGTTKGVATQTAIAEQGATGPPKGTIWALDLLEMEPLAGVQFLQGDFRQGEVLAQLRQALGGARLDAVVSDMAPNLSGVAAVDSARMADLLELALEFCATELKPEGVFVSKLFHGSGYSQLIELLKKRFAVVKAHKPKASRARSAETFVVARQLKRLL